jgi:hypothetical protein
MHPKRCQMHPGAFSMHPGRFRMHARSAREPVQRWEKLTGSSRKLLADNDLRQMESQLGTGLSFSMFGQYYSITKGTLLSNSARSAGVKRRVA